MLRIELRDSAKTMMMRIQGSFYGKFADDARGLIAHCRILPKLIVDLSEATFVDAKGEEVLCWLGQVGGEFIARSTYSHYLCERLHLPLLGGLPRRHRTQCGRSQSSMMPRW